MNISKEDLARMSGNGSVSRKPRSVEGSLMDMLYMIIKKVWNDNPPEIKVQANIPEIKIPEVKIPRIMIPEIRIPDVNVTVPKIEVPKVVVNHEVVKEWEFILTKDKNGNTIKIIARAIK